MLENGDDPGKVTDASFDKAFERIQKAVKSGQIRQFTGNDYAGLLAKGDIIAAVVWSGDIVQLQADNKYLRFTLPKAGGIIWTDNMLIPKGGDAHNASIFMNYVYDPKIAAQIEDYVNYICPVKGADKVLLKTDPEVGEEPADLPAGGDAGEAAPERPEGALQRRLQDEMAEAARRLSAPSRGGFLHRNRG